MWIGLACSLPATRCPLLLSSVALAHDEVERAEDGDDVGHEVADADLGEDGEIAEGRRADLQAPRDTAALAHDIKPQRALRVFRLKINFSGRHLRTLGDEHEILDQLL